MLFGFQSTLPRGERQQRQPFPETLARFQSTLPRGERPRGQTKCARPTGFNPRSRAGSDGCVSAIFVENASFNPRSRAGSDTNSIGGKRQTAGFNPRSRAGSDINLIQDVILRVVSIHAPARGATINVWQPDSSDCGFNPRSRAGSDRCYPVTSASWRKFQSTLPRGERRPNSSEKAH